MNAIALRDELIAIISSCEKIWAVGQTGSLDAKLIPGKSDIDLFVLCDKVPDKEERRNFYDKIQIGFELQMEVCNGGQWGYGDILVVDGIDVMPMYFTIEEMQQYLEEILQCRHLEKEGRFYPVGRAASVAAIQILYEKDEAWTKLKNMVDHRPETFFRNWFNNEMSQVIDEEDFGRCEIRPEILFFHQVLENALDHFLQALYAVNDCYFPSRKRTMKTIETFQNKPESCYERLVQIIQNAVKEETMAGAMKEMRILAQELQKIGETRFQK